MRHVEREFHTPNESSYPKMSGAYSYVDVTAERGREKALDHSLNDHHSSDGPGGSSAFIKFGNRYHVLCVSIIGKPRLQSQLYISNLH